MLDRPHQFFWAPEMIIPQGALSGVDMIRSLSPMIRQAEDQLAELIDLTREAMHADLHVGHQTHTHAQGAQERGMRWLQTVCQDFAIVGFKLGFAQGRYLELRRNLEGK